MNKTRIIETLPGLETEVKIFEPAGKVRPEKRIILDGDSVLCR